MIFLIAALASKATFVSNFMPTKLNRITINLTDEQVASLPPAPTKTERVMKGLGFAAPERAVNFKYNNPRATKARRSNKKIEKQPDYSARIVELEQEAVYLRERHIAQQNQLAALESRLQEERAQILQIIEKEKHWVQYDFQPDVEDSPNSVGAWVCERLAEEIETYPHLACIANTENKQVNENDGDWRDKAYRGEDY